MDKVTNLKKLMFGALLASSIFFDQKAVSVQQSLIDQLGQSQNLVANQYPGAQAWYECMIRKYPVAALNHVPFCVGDCSRAQSGAIYFPASMLEALENAFSAQSFLSVDNSSLNQFALYEWILLHEACHVISGDSRVVDAALLSSIAACVAGLALGPIGPMVAAGACAGGLRQMSLKHELRADQFANDHATKVALLAVIEYFTKADSKSSDYVHPDPSVRKENALKALRARFG